MLTDEIVVRLTYGLLKQGIKGIKYNGCEEGIKYRIKSGTRTLLFLGQFSVSPTTSDTD